uniref:Cadherin N-terminal domain-containing protein n=1 Tax=Amphilophus citrinellus TaxID=61819 RepID=A0A3Q0R9W6_AMPCI
LRNRYLWLALWWHHFFLLWSTIDGQTRYSISEELKQGSVVGNLAKDLGLGLSDIFERKLITDFATTVFKLLLSLWEVIMRAQQIL